MATDIFGLIGTTIHGRYRIDSIVGEGGFGLVYKGFHLSFEHPIAIKCLKVPGHFTPEAEKLFFDKFRDEGKLLSKLSDHASIVRVFDFGVADTNSGRRVPFLVLEWLAGQDLEHLLSTRTAPYDEQEALRLLRPAIDAIALAHSLQVAHRDLKPANLFLAETVRGPLLKVLDFGIAKAMQEGESATQLATRTTSGFSAFSPQYGAPEQFRSKKFGATGPWTDVHAMGLILVEMVSRRPALDGDEFAEFLEASTADARPTPRARGAVTSDGFEALCTRALSLMPTARFAHAGALLAAVDALLGTNTLATQPTTALPATTGGATSQPVAHGASGPWSGGVQTPPTPPSFGSDEPVPPPASPFGTAGTEVAAPVFPVAPQIFATAPQAFSPNVQAVGDASGPRPPAGGGAGAGWHRQDAPGGTAPPMIAGTSAPLAAPRKGVPAWALWTLGSIAVAAGIAMVIAKVASKTSGDPVEPLPVVDVTPASAATNTAPPLGSVRPVPFELYVMSQCPYCAPVEVALKTIVDELGPAVAHQIDFVGSISPDGELSSMHGPKELVGDLAQVCAMKRTGRWLDFVVCQGENAREVDTNWESCATKVGVPADDLRRCIEGPEGKELLRASFARSKARGVTGTPTIYIAGQKYQGNRSSADLERTVCAAFDGAKPKACSELPEAPRVAVKILSDARCSDCDVSRLEGQLRGKIAYPQITKVDYGDPEGRRLFEAIKPAPLPVAVFDASLDGDKEATAALARGLRRAGDYRVLELGGRWNPVCADAGGCSLTECAQSVQCRPETPGSLDVFVMSECPFCAKAMAAMKQVLADFQGTLAFSVHFIGDGTVATGLRSMHGDGEVEEDIRQVCAIDRYAAGYRFMNYIWCRDKDVKNPDWRACTGIKTGVAAEVVELCVRSGEGATLLERSFGHSKSLGMSASPTWLVNGRYKFSGIDAETIKANVCAHNGGMRGCN